MKPPSSVWLAGLAAVGLLSAGCGEGTSSPTGTPRETSIDRSDPGAVAAAFENALALSNYSVTKQLVDPKQAPIMAAVAGNAATVTKGVTSNLTVGSTSISGSSGTVTLVGKVCATGSDCIENTDAHTANSAYIVHVVKLSNRWYVHLEL